MSSIPLVRSAAIIAFATMLSPAAEAQQFPSYNFDPQNRAQIAVAMKQIEDSGNGGIGSGGGAGSTTIVCGGGASTATANNTCIILNGSTGQVATDQLSDGDQASTNSESVTLTGETISGADEVLSTLTQ